MMADGPNGALSAPSRCFKLNVPIQLPTSSQPTDGPQPQRASSQTLPVWSSHAFVRDAIPAAGAAGAAGVAHGGDGFLEHRSIFTFGVASDIVESRVLLTLKATSGACHDIRYLAVSAYLGDQRDAVSIVRFGFGSGCMEYFAVISPRYEASGTSGTLLTEL